MLVVRFVMVLFGLLALTGCGKNYQWNQKVTVEVMTPQGVKSGSSVQYVTWTAGGEPKFAQSGAPSSAKMVGEAPVVNLGDGKYLFALLRGDGKSFMGNAPDLAQFAFCSQQEMAPGAACFTRLRDMAAGTSAVLAPENMPMLVTFTDVNNPKTVKLVDPAKFAAAFGEGYTLKSISVEITDEKVTEGPVEHVLGWFKNYSDESLRLNGKRCVACPVESENLADLIGAGLFKVRKHK
jgi:hypothetical protein